MTFEASYFTVSFTVWYYEFMTYEFRRHVTVRCGLIYLWGPPSSLFCSFLIAFGSDLWRPLVCCVCRCADSDCRVLGGGRSGHLALAGRAQQGVFEHALCMHGHVCVHAVCLLVTVAHRPTT